MTPARVLVTGAAGLIGGAVARRLAADGIVAIATDAREAKLPDGVRCERADLSDRAAVEALLRRQEIDSVIHCGAISGPMAMAGDPHRVMAVNVGGTLNLAEAARKAGVARFLALSSAAVYGAQPNLDAVSESAPLNATDIYGASKIAMEATLRAYERDLGLPAAVLRVASVYGPGRTTQCFVRDLIRSAATGVPLAISAERMCRRQFVHVDDVVRAIVQAVAAPDLADFAYNVGGGTWLTEPELAAVAAAVLPGLKISDLSAPARCLDGRMGPLDNSRAAGAFGYRPAVELRQGIASYAAFLAAQAA